MCFETENGNHGTSTQRSRTSRPAPQPEAQVDIGTQRQAATSETRQLLKVTQTITTVFEGDPALALA